MNRPNKIIVHHTGGTDRQPLADSSHAKVSDIDSWHKLRWPGFTSRAGFHVGYHYVIERDGKVTQTRQHDEEGAHCIGQNLSSIGIVLSGNFDLTKPTKEQEKSFRKVVNGIMKEFPKITGNDIFPHRKYANKTCYGLNLDDNYFQQVMKVTDEVPTIKSIATQIDQLRTQVQALLTRKRFSKREKNRK